MSKNEYGLLLFLMTNKNRVVSRQANGNKNLQFAVDAYPEQKFVIRVKNKKVEYVDVRQGMALPYLAIPWPS